MHEDQSPPAASQATAGTENNVDLNRSNKLTIALPADFIKFTHTNSHPRLTKEFPQENNERIEVGLVVPGGDLWGW